MKNIITIFLILFSLNLSAQLALPSIFSENMVLQRDAKIPVWGKSKPHAQVTVTFLNQKKIAIADYDGNWKVELEPVPANFNPQILSIESSGGDKIVFKNVVVGDVWLCSGQSNMQFELWRDKFSDKFAPQKTNPKIRYFGAWRFNFKPYECDDCLGAWNVCDTNTKQNLSAVAYYFARALEKKIDAPIGLIESDYGGTRVEAWTDADTLSKWQHLKDELAQVVKYKNYKRFELFKELETKKWFDDLKKVDKGFAGNWMLPKYDDSKWQTIENPVQWKNSGFLKNYSGALWYRKNIVIPDKWKNKNLVVQLGPMLDYEISFLNGKYIGCFQRPVGNWYLHKHFVKKGSFETGENTIAVCLLGNNGNAGMFDPRMRVFPEDNPDDAIIVTGKWRIAKGCAVDKYVQAPTSITLNPNSLSVLFNSMIAPIIPYAIKGAIWYQGESNRGNAEQYQEMFTDMIKSWRKLWNCGDFPFYFVQIAPFTYNDPFSSPPLQEAQLFSLQLTNTGMAVTMDIGDLKDIHPTNKKDVGERLARWALAKTYGFKNIIFSGPLYKNFKIDGDKIIISFDYADGLKTKDGQPPSCFEIAGKDGKFISAKAEISDDKIIVYSEKIKKPTAARYAWSDTAQPNLCNAAGLPASPFRTLRD